MVMKGKAKIKDHTIRMYTDKSQDLNTPLNTESNRDVTDCVHTEHNWATVTHCK